MLAVFNQLSLMQQIILILTTAATILLGIYAINWSLLTILSIKGRRKIPPAPQLQDYPEITIHIPLFNEKQVAGRLIESCLKMDYPQDKLKIIIIDDSNDETTDIVRDFENKFPNIIKLIHRESREGYKAGALQAALRITTSDFIMIFDADYSPPPYLLKKLVPYIYLDDNIAFVQTRLTYLNSKQSWITKATSLALDGYGIIDQRARYSANLLAHFSGTGGIFRRSALESVGGWASDTLAEDLDLSIRLQLAGWRYVYLYDLTCPGEMPPSFRLVRKQQFRWAKGFAQCFRKYYREIISSDRLSVFQKFEALILLATYFICPISIFSLILMIPYLALFPISFFFNEYWKTVFGPIASSFSVAIYLAPFLLYGTTVSELSNKDQQGFKRLVNIIGIALIGLGTFFTNSKASIEGLLNKNSVYERTIKYGTVDN